MCVWFFFKGTLVVYKLFRERSMKNCLMLLSEQILKAC